MSSTASEAEEAMTRDELAGAAAAASSESRAAASGPATTTTAESSQPSSASKSKRNAFAELMSRKPKPAAPAARGPSASWMFASRDGLGAYTANPASFPASKVIYHNEDFVAVHDLYPKASIHTLLLPRSPAHQLLHPFDAFEDPEFLAKVQAETATLKRLVARELRRRYGTTAAAGERISASGGSGDSTEVVARDWEAELRVGIHAHPSMNHLHVHVLSREMRSASMRHRKHYNSFTTPFLIDVSDFPLSKDDVRRHPGREGYLDRDLECWRCGRNFGNKFKALKEHLEVEYERWKGGDLGSPGES